MINVYLFVNSVLGEHICVSIADAPCPEEEKASSSQFDLLIL